VTPPPATPHRALAGRRAGRPATRYDQL